MRLAPLAVLLLLIGLAGCVEDRPAPEGPLDAEEAPPRIVEGTQDNFTVAMEDDAVVFADGFETGLIPPWTGMQRVWPVAALPSPYNEVEQSRERVHSGDFALRTHAKWSRAIDPHPALSTVSKADIMHTELDFRPGDDEWFTAWFYLEDAPDAFGLLIADFEAPNAGDISPGLRLLTTRPDYLDGFPPPPGPAYLYINAKGFGQSIPPTHDVAFPIGEWVHIVVHLKLDTELGAVQVWQDGQLILDAHGPTIPNEDAVYTNLQVGLTANQGYHDHTLFVDDVVVGRTAEAIGWSNVPGHGHAEA